MLQLEKRYAPTFGEKSELDIARKYPFATVISFGEGEPVCSHIPMLADGIERIEQLRGHLARGNVHARSLVSGSRMLVIFTGPQSYVTPNWYETPSERAPTWNYAVVHVWGTIRPTNDAELDKMLDDLSAVSEAEFAEPWLPNHLNPARRSALLPAIIGFEMCVDRIESRFKLNQHNTVADRQRVISSLIKRGDDDSAGVARLMQETLDRDEAKKQEAPQSEGLRSPG